MTVTYKELGEMRRLLDSIDFLEDSDETADSFEVYAKWNVKGTGLILQMRRNLTISVYENRNTLIGLLPARPAIMMPKLKSLEDIISDESLDKKQRVKLAWLLGQIDNG